MARKRRRSRNAWFGNSRGHRRAAMIRWHGHKKTRKARKGRKVQKFVVKKARTQKRRGRGRRLSKPTLVAAPIARRLGLTRLSGPTFSAPLGRSSKAMKQAIYRAKKRKASGLARVIGKNPGKMVSSALGSIKAGFSIGTLKEAGLMTAGAVGVPLVKAQIQKLSFVPSFLKSGIGGSILGLATAGLVGAGVGMASKNLGAKVFLGGVTGELISVIGKQVLPMVGMGSFFDGDDYLTQDESSLSDYLSVSDAAGARSLGGLRDYLTPADAAGAMSLGDITVGQELA